MSQYEAVKLFIDRAASAVPAFKVTNENAPAVAQICDRLDGIPLAIELAAAKVHVLGVDQIAKRLDDRFRLLTGGSRTALERHQTLRAAIDWSYNLLSEEEKVLFARLSVFNNGWTLEAVEQILSQESGGFDVLDLLTRLVEKSLVILDGSRYRMLETTHQYAREKLLESGESESLHDKHLAYFIDLAETAIRQTQIVQDPLVSRRQLRSALQAVDRSSIVTILIQREAEVVQRVEVSRCELIRLLQRSDCFLRTVGSQVDEAEPLLHIRVLGSFPAERLQPACGFVQIVCPIQADCLIEAMLDGGRLRRHGCGNRKRHDDK